MSDADNTLLHQIRDDVTKLFIMVERISTQLEHGDSRFDRICDKLDKTDERVDDIERRLDKHDGELTFGGWVWKGLVGLGVIAAAVIAYFK